MLLGYHKEIVIDAGRTLSADEKLQVITSDPDGKKYAVKLVSTSPNVFAGLFFCS